MNASWIACGLIMASVPSRAHAEEVSNEAQSEAEPGELGREGVSALIQAGFTHGLAAGAQLDWGQVSLAATGGYMPLLLSGRHASGLFSARAALVDSYQLNLEALAFLVPGKGETRMGLHAGYRLNSFLRHGVAFGGRIEVAAFPSSLLLLDFSAVFYPGGQRRAASELGVPDADLYMSGLQIGVGVGLKI